MSRTLQRLFACNLTPLCQWCPACIRRDDLADAGGIAQRRIDAGPLSGEMVQIALEPLQLANPRPNLGAMLLKELQHMRTRSCSAIANLNYLPDLSETQAYGLRRPDERQSRHGIWLVRTVA